MKETILLLLTIVIFSCQPTQPTPTPPNATPNSGIYGDWNWYKHDIVNYDMNGVENSRTSSNFPPQNVHTYSSNGLIYAYGSNNQLGTHSNSNLVVYNNLTLYVTELTATTMVMKENPNGCVNCSSTEYFFKRP